MRRGRSALLAVLVVVGAVSWWVRAANGLRIAAATEDGGEAAWFVHDPDSLYHMRRLDRALLEGGNVASRDPLLAWPDHAQEGGAPIPWPATYTRVLHALTAPSAPQDQAARELLVEHAVATWPACFSAITSVLAALAAGALAGAGAALFSGLVHATLFVSLKYGYLGQGDHHAWISMLHGAWLVLASHAFAAGRMERPGIAGPCGAACGLLAGAALGSWVASLVLVALFQVALGIAILGHARRRVLPGLAPFGLAFHLAALAVVVPEVTASPWAPFEVVNLSWFHVAELLLGALVFVPLLRLRGGSDALRRYPSVVLAALGVVIGVAFLGPLRSEVAAGFAWAAGANDFMGFINESQPLLWGVGGGVGPLVKWLGLGVLALPFAWFAACRAREPELLPWVVAAPALLALALLQRRFGDSLAAPMAVLLGWGWARLAGGPLRRVPWAVLGGLTCVLPLAASAGPVRTAWARTVQRIDFVDTEAFAAERGLRELCRWLREETTDVPQFSVLAQWDLGHLVEWVARRPTVATNFGSYLGDDSYLDPWRFLLAVDEAQAEQILERRESRYVLLAADWTRNLDTMTRVVGPLEESAMALRMSSEEGPSFLRLVNSARLRVNGEDRGAAGKLFELVRGARVEARGAPGELLEVRLELRYPGEPELLVWRRSALVATDGTVRLRVPYTTEAGNGVGRSVGKLAWNLGEREGEIALSEAAVLAGTTVPIL